ncbi:glycosyltransferase family 4 protein [Ferrimonas balearica]|uniref:glycosyltransferase family 4 protein n=1 Tax=Ferrimonas balearica TaxID=44012 RepID=UPI001F4441AE|nr:glycosyltransferase family 4 protein [Ferrimonas balearica]MBY6094622.1 glycosyltransferase family 4 protein [Ferrimonas balearica]
MKKILHITNAYPYEGHPEYGCFIKEQIESISALVLNSVLFVNAHRDGKKAYFEAIKSIRELATEADLVHCHHVFSFILFKLSGVRDKPVVLSFLNDWTKEIKFNVPEFLKGVICRTACLLSDKVIFKSFVPSQLNGSKFTYLPNGVDENTFNIIERAQAKSQLGLDLEKDYVLFVSSKNLYRKQKRYDIFTETMKQLNHIYPGRYCELTMSIDDRTTALLKFNAASLHYLSSDYEGSPNSVKESLSCGTPVITRQAGSASDLVDSVASCFVIDDFDAKLVAKKIDDIVSSDVDRELIRRQFLAKGFTKEATAEKLVNIYSEFV